MGKSRIMGGGLASPKNSRGIYSYPVEDIPANTFVGSATVANKSNIVTGSSLINQSNTTTLQAGEHGCITLYSNSSRASEYYKIDPDTQSVTLAASGDRVGASVRMSRMFSIGESHFGLLQSNESDQYYIKLYICSFSDDGIRLMSTTDLGPDKGYANGLSGICLDTRDHAAVICITGLPTPGIYTVRTGIYNVDLNTGMVEAVAIRESDDTNAKLMYYGGKMARIREREYLLAGQSYIGRYTDICASVLTFNDTFTDFQFGPFFTLGDESNMFSSSGALVEMAVYNYNKETVNILVGNGTGSICSVAVNGSNEVSALYTGYVGSMLEDTGHQYSRITNVPYGSLTLNWWEAVPVPVNVGNQYLSFQLGYYDFDWPTVNSGDIKLMTASIGLNSDNEFYVIRQWHPLSTVKIGELSSHSYRGYGIHVLPFAGMYNGVLSFYSGLTSNLVHTLAMSANTVEKYKKEGTLTGICLKSLDTGEPGMVHTATT